MQAITLPLLLLACKPLEAEQVTAEIDENITTLVHVDFATHEPTQGWVRYGTTTDYDHVTPIDAEGTDHHLSLFGMPADTKVHYQVVVTDGVKTVTGDDQAITTGSIPSKIPPIAAERYSDSALWGDYTIIPWWETGDDDSFVGIVDRDGKLVWYWIPDWGWAECVRPSEDGTALNVLLAGVGADPDARIVHVPLDGSDPTVMLTPYAHHDFREVDGVIAYIAGEVQEIDGEEILGDRIMEMDADGNATEVWNAFDSYPVVENNGWSNTPADWTHANGIGYDPVNDAWLLSLYWDRTVMRIDRATGEIAWRLGGLNSDFLFPDADDRFGAQHAPQWVEGGLLLFDNGDERASSRLVQLSLDETNMQASVAWSWDAPDGEHTRLMGAVARLPGGGSVSGWGEKREVLSVDEDGEIVRRITVDADSGLVGHIERVDSLYPADAVFPPDAE